MIKGGEEDGVGKRRSGNSISQVFLFSESRFSWAAGHEFLSCLPTHLHSTSVASLLLANNFSMLKSVCANSLAAKQHSNGGGFNVRGRQKGAKATPSFCSVRPNTFFVTCCHFKRRAFPDRIKSPAQIAGCAGASTASLVSVSECIFSLERERYSYRQR